MNVNTLDERDRFILNRLQGNFPICETPFQQLEKQWEIPNNELIDRIERLNRDNYLSRFGAVINTRALGGDSRLAAVEAEDNELEDVAEVLNGYQTVTHNYARDHELSLWFVLSADSCEQIDRTLENLEEELERRVYNLPKLTEYYVGLRFVFHEDGDVTTKNIPERLDEHPPANIEPNPTPEKSRLIRVIQEGLPIESRPYQTIAQKAERTEERVVKLCKQMSAEGIIKRLGCVPNHYKLGVKGNAMTVFDIPDDEIDDIGKRLGQHPDVTHCYERPRHEPIWPYNLFAMVHAPTPGEARDRVNRVKNEHGLRNYPSEILFSSRLYKKTGLRLQDKS